MSSYRILSSSIVFPVFALLAHSTHAQCLDNQPGFHAAGLTYDNADDQNEPIAVFDDGSGPAVFVGGPHLKTAGTDVAGALLKWDGSAWHDLG